MATTILCDVLQHILTTVHFPFSTCFSIIFHSYYYYVANGTIHILYSAEQKRYVALYMSSRSHSASLSPTKKYLWHIHPHALSFRCCPYMLYNVHSERVTAYIPAINLSEIMNLLFAKIIFIFMWNLHSLVLLWPFIKMVMVTMELHTISLQSCANQNIITSMKADNKCENMLRNKGCQTYQHSGHMNVHRYLKCRHFNAILCSGGTKQI